MAFVPIKDLPNGLSVGGHLVASYTQLTNLPYDLRVGGALNLHGSQIQSLPNGLKVDGKLDLRHTPINHLPSGLVARDLDISYTKLVELPEDIRVGVTLYIEGTNLKSLPDSIPDDIVIDTGRERYWAFEYRQKLQMKTN